MLAPLTVDTHLDVVDFNDGLTSLREAIFAANTVPGADEIVFDLGDGPKTILLTQGELKITDSLIITGPGADLLTIDASGSDPTPDEDNGDGSRVFLISDGTSTVIDVEISGMTLTGGDNDTFGGAIHSWENLAIFDSRIVNNSSVRGGGILSRASVVVVDSTVSGNTARTAIRSRDPDGGYGGGINAGQLTLTRSTVSENTARLGAGIMSGATTLESSLVASNFGTGMQLSGSSFSIVDSAIVNNSSRGISTQLSHGSIVNSTISGNQGGGLLAFGETIHVRHSTITENGTQNGLGGGIQSTGLYGQVRVHSSIIAGNSGSDVAMQNPTFISEGYNLIGVGNAAGAFIQSGDQTGVLDPQLGPLADNGGPTPNHALLPGSPAVNGGDPNAVSGENGVPDFDQRGEPFNRIFGSVIDIGSYEWQPLVVDTLVDENDGDYSEGNLSLREAIDLANGIEGENTIEFDPSLLGRRILLNMDELVITDHVHIVGPGADQLVIDARWMSRVIHVDGSTTSLPREINVSIEGLTIANGVAPSNPSIPVQTRSRGAGVFFISAGHLNLDDVIVRGNRAFGINAAGAGVYVSRGITTVSNSQFIENRCVDANAKPHRGAAIHSDNDVSVTDSVFSDNIGHVIHVIRDFGNSSVDVSLTRTEISNNSGMALLAEGVVAGTVQVIESTINRNSEGGILAWNGLLTVTDSFVTNNGGAVGSSSGLSTGGDITVIRSTVSGNRASGGGGLWGGRHIVVTDSFITNNHNINEDDRYGGGGIFQYALNTNVPGAPIPCDGTLTITRSVISNNMSATDGGGIDTNAQVTITESTIANNHAMGRGGGIFGEHQSSITLLRSTVDGNTAIGLRQSGAGIYSLGDVAVKYSTISNNRGTSTQPTFGGIVANDVTLLNATISGNSRGGIHASSIDARHSTITQNTGTGLYAPIVSLDHTIVAGNIFSNQYESDVQAQNLQAKFSHISVGATYLGPLANNGGPTKTHKLNGGSPAINAGDPSFEPGWNGSPEFDQRGAPFTREYQARIDIGAFEVQHTYGSLHADFDSNGRINGRDFLIWQRNFGENFAGQSNGDATGNGTVDGNDLAVWQETYGRSWPPPRIVDFVLAADEPAVMYANDVESGAATMTSSSPSVIDAAFDDWQPPRRAVMDFGDMVTRRKALRALRR